MNVEAHLAFHGAIILFLSFLSGGFFAHAINSKDREVAWRVVHSGGSMGGVMLIAFASSIHFASLGSLARDIFAWLAIVGTWALVIGMLVAAFTGQRGLKFGGSAVGNLVYSGYLLGSVFSLGAVGILVVGFGRSLR